MTVNETRQHIDEACNVEWLKFQREAEFMLKGEDDDKMRQVFNWAFCVGWGDGMKVAMQEARAIVNGKETSG
jgi:hypothetical protein